MSDCETHEIPLSLDEFILMLDNTYLRYRCDECGLLATCETLTNTCLCEECVMSWHSDAAPTENAVTFAAINQRARAVRKAHDAKALDLRMAAIRSAAAEPTP